MQKIREQISLVILVVVYLLASVRLFRANDIGPVLVMKSMVETYIHMLSIAPITIGATLLVVSLLQGQIRERLPLSRSIRIFLVVAICLEFILGLAHYFDLNGTVV